MAWPKGRPRSEETKQRMAAGQRGLKRSAEACANISRSLIGHAVSEESKKKNAASHIGKKDSPETRTAKTLARKKSPIADLNFRGGRTGEMFAAILCPAGFVREHIVQWGRRPNERFVLDFAHVEGKVCIELDGKSHETTKDSDKSRDDLLRALGWRVIRINHA